MSDSPPLANHAALVTGGGTGIGRACAAALAVDGAKVTICGRTEAKLQAAADQIGHDVDYVVADVTDEASVKAALDHAEARTGQLKAVVANAGGGGFPAPLHVSDTDEYRRLLEVNLMGTYFSIKHAVPKMVAAGGGSFIGMSSIAGHVTHPHFGAYPTAKAGIESLCKNAADEYGQSGVRFNAIQPGFIATEMMELIPRDSEVYASYIENTPMADVGQPEDVGALARFLVGPESRWITGQCIGIDGGHSLRRGPDFSPFIADMLGPDVMAGNLPPAD